MSSEAHSVPLTIVEGSGTVGSNDSWSRAHIEQTLTMATRHEASPPECQSLHC